MSMQAHNTNLRGPATPPLGPGRMARAVLCLAFAAVSVVIAPASAAQDDFFEPYSARYALYRNGKLQARSEFLLQQQGDNWIIKSESIGTHGMARLLNFRDYEYAEGRLKDGLYQPLRYVHELKWLGPNQDSSADFDWDNNEVTVTDNGEPRTLELVAGSLDPMSMQLAIRRQLASADPQLEFTLVEEDKIEQQVFRALSPERLETSLGCLHTIPVEKVRENSTRFTRLWHATELDHIPVRMEHGKTDGDQMELRITELVIDGTPVEPQPGCAAEQEPAPDR